ncbi:MAG TPA: DNA polymerase IV [Clostridiales bacterium]|nr:DNA polymerase IV [Clostridiales bacterium]
MDRTILHVDINNFFAAVECLYNPEIRDKPVAVAGDVELRHGIVLAKNLIAKSYGVRTGETLSEARAKCPGIVFVPPHMERYIEFSRRAREIYDEYTHRVESFGIDECWLDVSGDARSGKEIADEIRERVKKELGITASVGVSYNKVFAKMGSDYKKPDATTVITRENFRKLLWPLPVTDLLFVGGATARKLKLYGIRSIGDLACADFELIRGVLGKNGCMLWKFANGLDRTPVLESCASIKIKSIGNSTTTPRDLVCDDDVRVTLYVLCESVAARLREQCFKCTTVQIHVRDSSLESYERQVKLPYETWLARDIFDAAFMLYKRHHDGRPIRTLGVRAMDLVSQESAQIRLLPESPTAERDEALELAVFGLRERFGNAIVRRGILLTDPKLSSFSPRDEHVIHPELFDKQRA